MLTDLSKTFDCIRHNLLIGKFCMCGLSFESPKLIQKYSVLVLVILIAPTQM